VSAGCGLLGKAQQPRHYYVLAVDPLDKRESANLRGLVRIANMDTASAYDKFQIVIRESPYQLQYSDLNVWAVKPGRMVSDVIGEALRDASTFDAITRELGEKRPDYTMSGNLEALEIYQSGDQWFVHLSMSLSFRSFTDGELLWAFDFDQRKAVPTGNFATSVRGLSELMSVAIQQSVDSLGQALRTGDRSSIGHATMRRERRDVDIAEDVNRPPEPPPSAPVILPEKKPLRPQ
ncbi:MAG: membrane integrity-associated transporter subunit PqiC, partial [Clostridia bacterium]|nr:membrane integrity-associated transporter subunit PqiC [Deltaproteobacteria bacterium]